jgi:hypothetical protein
MEKVVQKEKRREEHLMAIVITVVSMDTQPEIAVLSGQTIHSNPQGEIMVQVQVWSLGH